MSGNACRYGRQCKRPDCYFAHPEGRDIDGGRVAHGGGQSSRGGGTPCRFDRKCNRPECYFSHPNGRDIDNMYGAPVIANGHSSHPHHFEQFENDDEMMSNLEDAANEDPAGYHQDQWIPTSRDCPCCKGFVYNCSDPTCQSLGVCGCSAEAELDL